MNYEILKLLAGGGLRVIDLGLESASRSQLISMGKTSRPERYLEKASELLQACSDEGVWAKLNILLYAGETSATIDETVQWLDKHVSKIKGISANSVTAYGCSQGTRTFVADLLRRGAIVDSSSLKSVGILKSHLSREIDYEASQRLVRRIAQRYMSQRDYYDLKKFSYFDRGYSYAEFVGDLVGISDEELPFRRL